MHDVRRRSGSVQSVDRAVSVLELLARRGWSGVTEVAGELGIHKSNAHRLLATLSDRGMVEQNSETEKYRLGFGLVGLASAVTADLDVVRYARPVCQRLSERTRETVTLTVLEAEEAVIVHQSSSSSSVLGADWSGWRLPLHCTPGGKVLLAHLPEDRQRRVLGKPLERFTGNTIVDPDQLRGQLEDIQSGGYAYTVEELETGLNGVGAPIYRSGGEVVAAMSVAGPAFRLPAEAVPETGRLTRDAATDVSQRLGFHS
ncbi:MAG: IclR family transcriptional regulator [Rubrobacter sp.]|nr:IclR family transcriptional regulator [Rubrobacter sp.]